MHGFRSTRVLMWVCTATLAAGCAGGPREPAVAAPTVHGVALPGAPADGVGMDVIAYDRARHRVWVPAGNTASVDLIDTADDSVRRIEGFPVTEIERHGQKRTVGPSAAAIGNGVVYVVNRGDNGVYALDADTAQVITHTRVAGMPDLVAFAATANEVWVTLPRDKVIVALDATSLATKDTIRFEGEPEGLVVDDARGLVYTNLEDKDRTLTIDLRSRKVVRDWAANAGEGGPKCLALDRAHDFLIVACPDHVNVLDAARDGKLLSTIDTGAGVDSIDYVESRHQLFAAASRAGKLTVAGLDADGTLTPIAVVDTATGARNAVATERGVAYLTDSPRGRILVVTPPAR